MILPVTRQHNRWLARKMAEARESNRARQSSEPDVDPATAPLVWPVRPPRDLPPLGAVPFIGRCCPMGEIDPPDGEL